MEVWSGGGVYEWRGCPIHAFTPSRIHSYRGNSSVAFGNFAAAEVKVVRE
jgi:hypothetical protein